MSIPFYGRNILRGGSWSSEPSPYLKVKHRAAVPRSDVYYFITLRLVRRRP
jgi:hypothetical protein